MKVLLLLAVTLSLYAYELPLVNIDMSITHEVPVITWIPASVEELNQMQADYILAKDQTPKRSFL